MGFEEPEDACCIASSAAAAAGFWYGLSSNPLEDGCPITRLVFVPPGADLKEALIG